MTSKENTEAVRRYHERQATRMDQRTSDYPVQGQTLRPDRPEKTGVTEKY